MLRLPSRLSLGRRVLPAWSSSARPVSNQIQVTFPQSAFEQPLTVPLPNMPTVPNTGDAAGSTATDAAHGAELGAAAAAAAGKKVALQMSVLPNGIRVCSQNATGHNAAVGVLVDTGTRFESRLNVGASQMLRLLAFQSTANRSAERMSDDISKIGGNLVCVHTRENIYYSGGVFSYHVPQAIELMADTIRYPQITPEEFEEQQSTAFYEHISLFQKPENLLPEIVHSVAYQQNNMGLPMYAEGNQIDDLSPTALKDFHQTFYQPSRLIVAGVGVDHAEFVDLVYKHFGDMKNQPQQEIVKLPARYTGGDLVQATDDSKAAKPLQIEDYDDGMHDPNDMTHLFVAFEGIPYQHPDLYAMATLQLMMGGGGSFSAGGPGKGMYSRLYVNVLNQYAWIHTAVAYVNCYSDTGLFGFHFAAEANHARKLYGVIAEELIKMTKPVKNIDLVRARNQLKSSLLMNLESRAVQLEDILKQVHILGKYIPAEELCAHIDQVTSDDINRVARKMLQSNPSVVTYGKVAGLPTDASEIFANFLKKSLM